MDIGGLHIKKTEICGLWVLTTAITQKRWTFTKMHMHARQRGIPALSQCIGRQRGRRPGHPGQARRAPFGRIFSSQPEDALQHPHLTHTIKQKNGTNKTQHSEYCPWKSMQSTDMGPYGSCFVKVRRTNEWSASENVKQKQGWERR